MLVAAALLSRPIGRFGAGWGIGGRRPGPGLASLAAGRLPVLVIAMAAGMVTDHVVEDALRATNKARSDAGHKPA